MKNHLIIPALLIGFNASAATKSVSLKCEEGVGNVSAPAQYLRIEGRINDTSKRGAFTEAEKSLLAVSVNDGAKLVRLNNREFKISVSNSVNGYLGSVQMRISLLAEKSDVFGYTINFYEDQPAESILKVIGSSWFTGKPKVIDSGLCWGRSPY